jgi:purine-binding chemotaxis protein CheW
VSGIGSEEIQETPHFGQDIDTNFIMGMGKLEEKLIMLLDIDKVLSAEELEMVEEIADN